MIEIKYYSKEFEAAHTEFAKKYMRIKRRHIPEYIYWKFRGKPGQVLKSFLLAVDGDKVVGQFGIIPSRMRIDDKVYDAQWACDLMVDPSYRGKGIAAMLYSFAHENRIITLGSDPSPAAEKSMTSSGYVLLNGPQKFVYPFNIGEAFKLKGINNRFLNKIPNPLLPVLYAFKNSDYKSISIENYEQLSKTIVSEHLCSSYDKSFYEWRFSAFKTYYPGIDCYKKDDFNLFSGYFVNGLYLLTEFKANSVSSFLKMIAFIYFKYRKSNILRIKFVSMNSKINAVLPFFGFIRFRTLTKVILFTQDKKIQELIKNKCYNYTLLDSDENI